MSWRTIGIVQIEAFLLYIGIGRKWNDLKSISSWDFGEFLKVTKESIHVKSHLWGLIVRSETYHWQRNSYVSNLTCEISNWDSTRISHKGIYTTQISVRSHKWDLTCIDSFVRFTTSAKSHWDPVDVLFRMYSCIDVNTCTGVPTILFYDNQL